MKLFDFARAMVMDHNPDLFLGDEFARQSYMEKMARIEKLKGEILTGQASGAQRAFMDEDEDPSDPDDLPRGVQITPNGTALMKISGELAPNVGFWGRMMGMTGYNEIIENLSRLSENAQVQRTLLMISSPGGSAMGIEATAEVIERADRIKPVYAFTDSQALSAAYWLGSSARRVYATKTARLGSIGVVTMHKEVTEMLKEEGISIEVLRAGEFKALGTPFEKLDDKARNIITNDLQTMYGFFLEAVGKNRGMTRQTLIEKAAEGRVFFGEDAKNVNLADDVLSLSAVLSRIERNTKSSGQRTPSAAPPSTQQNRGFSAMKKVRVFSSQAMAMLAEGADQAAVTKALGDKAYELISVEDAKAQGVSFTDDHLVNVNAAGEIVENEEEEEEDTSASGDDPEASDQPGGEGNDPGTGGNEPPSAAGAPDGGESEDPKASNSFDGLMTRLGDLVEKNAELRAEVSGQKSRMASLEAMASQMQGIVVSRIQHMQVAMNMTAIDDDTKMGTESLVALHDQVSEKFSKAFRSGRKSETKEQEAQEGSSTAHLANAGQASVRLADFGGRSGK